MSLLRRIEKGGKPQQILHNLISKIYPEEEPLKQVIVANIGDTTLLTDEDEKLLNSSPIDFVIGFRPNTQVPPIQLLLEQLDSDGQLSQYFEIVIEEEEIELSSHDEERVQTNLVDFLMGVPPSSQQRKSVGSNPINHETRILRDKILNCIRDNEEIQELATNPQPNRADTRRITQDIFNTYLEEHEINLPRSLRHQLFESIASEIVGFSILEPLLADEAVTEIRVLGAKNISITHNGMLKKTDLQFDDSAHLSTIINRIIEASGRRVDESLPILHFRMSDGSYVSITNSEIANNGPLLNIFKSNHKLLNQQDLIQFGTLSSDVMTMLHACVDAQCNILVTGWASVGKTTFLNVLGSLIPHHEFIATIEVSEELQLIQEAVASLHTRPDNITSKKAITVHQLLQHTHTMRPERLLVGELIGDTIHELLTSVVPWMTTLHARNPEDAISKLESMYRLADENSPIKAVWSRIADSIDLIVHLDRIRSGKRIVTRISEVHYGKDEHLIIHDLFRYEETQREGVWTTGELRLENLPSENLRQQMSFSPMSDDVLSQLESIFDDLSS